MAKMVFRNRWNFDRGNKLLETIDLSEDEQVREEMQLLLESAISEDTVTAVIIGATEQSVASASAADGSRVAAQIAAASATDSATTATQKAVDAAAAVLQIKGYRDAAVGAAADAVALADGAAGSAAQASGSATLAAQKATEATTAAAQVAADAAEVAQGVNSAKGVDIVTIAMLAPGATPTSTFSGASPSRTLALGIPASDASQAAIVSAINAATSLTPTGTWNFTTAPKVGGQSVVINTDARLTDARTPTAHSHAQSEVTGLVAALGGKAASVHSHATSDITGLDTALTGKAAAVHGHAMGDITGLAAALGTKAPTADPSFSGTITEGAADTDVQLLRALPVPVDARSVAVTYNGNGTVNVVTEKAGATTVKTTTYAYNGDGTVNTATVVAGGKTVVTTYTYSSGDCTGYTKAVS